MKTFLVAFISAFCLIVFPHDYSVAASVFAIPANDTERTTFFVCSLFSFATCLAIYLVKKRRREGDFGRTNFLGALLSDFWFDEFISRKILSLVYFVYYFVCLSFIFYYLVAGFQFSAVSFLAISSYLLLLVLGRVVLEFFAVVFRMAENTALLVSKHRKDSQESNPD